jgi:hypothetical protein
LWLFLDRNFGVRGKPNFQPRAVETDPTIIGKLDLATLESLEGSSRLAWRSTYEVQPAKSVGRKAFIFLVNNYIPFTHQILQSIISTLPHQC